MERREQYDPEDIENLLHERSFDELLEEERAYVLRHLSGREEYEQMRALLHHVRDDDRQHEPIEADDRIRGNVLQAFRAQQKPQWRVWLNSIGAIFIPGEGFAMWRPALAIGMVLLLFGVGFYLVRGPIGGTGTQELAEVRQKKAEEPLPVKTPVASDSINGVLEEGSSVASSASTSTSDQTPIPAAPMTIQHEFGSKNANSEMFDAEASADQQIALTEPEQEEDLVSEEKQSFEPATGHVVTEDEFARNQSVANAKGKVQTRSTERFTEVYAKKSIDADATSASSRSVSQDPALLDLLSAGW
ncbi:MAG: hypothetical protein M3R08_04405 [Bacteroidota bacterium]|nr:hypothetical protein [Bacteroidota bacterium]